MSPTCMGQSPSSRGWAVRQTEVPLRYSVDCSLGAFSCKAMMEPQLSLRGILFLSQIMGCPGQHHQKGEGVTGIPSKGQPWPPRNRFLSLGRQQQQHRGSFLKKGHSSSIPSNPEAEASSNLKADVVYVRRRKKGWESNLILMATCYKGFDFTL